MNSIIENAKRQFLTKRSVVGFIKKLVPALVAAAFLLSGWTAAAALAQGTEYVNLSGSQTLAVGTSTVTLINTADSTFAGNITGTGSIIKTGSRTLTLTNTTISYRGTTTISEGKLKLDGNNLALYFSSEIINNGVIETNCDQVFRNLSGTGAINVIGNSVDIDLVNTKDTTYSGSITGPATLSVQGGKTITLSGSISDVVRIEVDNGSQLKLTGSALDYNGTMRVFGGKSVEYEVVSGSKRYNITENNKIDVRATSDGGADGGRLIKSGDGTLKICCEAEGLVRADSVFISSGRMDYQGYFESALSPRTRSSSGWVNTDIVVVESDAILSPGETIGSMVLTHGNVTIKDSAILLFEFDAYNEDPSQQNFDTLVLNAPEFYFTVESGSIIDLAFLNNDATEWATEGAEYRLVTDQGFANGNYDYLLPEKYRSMFSLQGKNGNGLYLIGLGVPEPPMPVPEPSTWALLILGVVGLICVRKFRKE